MKIFAKTMNRKYNPLGDENMSEDKLKKEIEKLKAQLEIAIKVLQHYENKSLCVKALKKIEELNKKTY